MRLSDEELLLDAVLGVLFTWNVYHGGGSVEEVAVPFDQGKHVHRYWKIWYGFGWIRICDCGNWYRW